MKLMKIGAWIQLMIKERGFIGFTYVDSEAGFSAKGFMKDNLDNANVILRAPDCFGEWQELSEEACEGLKLPTPPDWLEHYGPQPEQGTLWGQWRAEEALKGKFHPQALDDLQVIVHDGGPRISDTQPEAIWARVHGIQGENLYAGTVLNTPHQLKTVAKFDKISFTTDPALEFPVQVREKYLKERDQWTISPCNKCGSSLLFDAPSELIAKTFPEIDVDEPSISLTAFCGYCGGFQALSRKSQD